MPELFRTLQYDLPASVVIFFVAVPLFLGIALASGAPLFSGITAGIVVGGASGSPLGVSGPAAGLAVIVLGAIATLGGSFEAFLVAVVLAGLLQIAMGYARLGVNAYYSPSSGIKGMLSGIGLLIIIKQVARALGHVGTSEVESVTTGGDAAFGQFNSRFESSTPGALLVSSTALLLLVSWRNGLAPRAKIFKVVPGPLAAVAVGMLLRALMTAGALPLTLAPSRLVAIPVADSVAQLSEPRMMGAVRPLRRHCRRRSRLRSLARYRHRPEHRHRRGAAPHSAQSRVVIDGSRSKVVDFDVLEMLRDFRRTASVRRIAVEVHGMSLDAPVHTVATAEAVAAPSTATPLIKDNL